jgi:hypothetical protein
MPNIQKYPDEVLFRSGPGYWQVSWIYIVASIAALWMMFVPFCFYIGFGVMVLLFVETLHSRADWRNRELQRTIRESGGQEIGVRTRACPRCAETIKAAALVCRFCGHGLQSLESHATDGATKPTERPSPSPPPAAPTGSQLAKPLSPREAKVAFDDAINEALGKNKTDT